MSDGDVFFRVELLWGVAPPILLILCVTTWHLLSKCKKIGDLEIKMKTSCVALLYLVWPSLCSQTFSLFACRRVCDDETTFLRVDLEVPCWEGRHATYALLLGSPMLFLYVIGLPVAALFRVRSMHQKSVIDKEEEKIYGMFYTAFRKETWWWEGTVAARKIVIALIGVFGTDLRDMQVHLTLMFVVFILLATSQIRPFGGLKHGILHILEMASLMATFLTLWAGSVFNTRPKCEDPMKGEGSTLVWCDALSIMVGLVDIVVLLAIGISFVYIKATSSPDEIVDDDTILDFENPMREYSNEDHGKKKRRLSSRELMIEMSDQNNVVADALDADGASTGKTKQSGHATQSNGDLSGTDPILDLKTLTPESQGNGAPRAHWNRIKMVTKASSKFKRGGKRRIKRLSKVMKSRRNSVRSIDAQAENPIYVDPSTGQRYSVSQETGESTWLVEEDDVNEQESGDETIQVEETVEEAVEEAVDEAVEEAVEEAVHIDPTTGRRYNSKGWL